MPSVSVRYIVHDVDQAVDFYCGSLGFEVQMRPAPTFAMLTRGDLRLALSAPSGQGGGGQSMPDGRVPEPGGWNRFMLVTEALDALIARLRGAGATFRGEISAAGVGRAQLVEDPSGNLVELFEFKRD